MTEEVKDQTTEGQTPEAPKAPSAPEAPKADKVPEWVEKRFGELTAKRHDAERAAQQAAAHAAAMEAKLQEVQAKGPQPANIEEIRAQIRAEEGMRAKAQAAQELAAAQFTETCNKIAVAGKKDFNDFDEMVRKLQSVEGLTPEMVLAAAEMDNPQQIIHSLGADLDEALRIKSLPPIKQAAAIAKLSSEVAKEKRAAARKTASSAPEPITPIHGSSKGEVDLYDDNSDARDWYEKRERDLAERAKRGLR